MVSFFFPFSGGWGTGVGLDCFVPFHLKMSGRRDHYIKLTHKVTACQNLIYVYFTLRT